MRIKWFMFGVFASAILCGVIFYKVIKQMPSPKTKTIYVSEKDFAMIKLGERERQAALDRLGP